VGYDPAAVAENRRRLCLAVGAGVEDLTLAAQVHGAGVALVTAAERGRGGDGPTTAIAGVDALVSEVPGVLLGVLSADCVPVVLLDPRRRALGVAHAGWRGTVGRVAEATVQAMAAAFGTRPGDLRAGIGPSIGPASYEVGHEVVAAAQAVGLADAVSGGRPDGGGRFDLWRANVALLVGAGVPAEAIEVCGADTATSTDAYFSHRAEAPTGRFMTVARLSGRAR
jgi:YfiH family protein